MAKKTAMPEPVKIAYLSKYRSERINFRCSPYFKEVLRLVRKKESTKQTWSYKNSDADVIEEALKHYAKHLKLKID